MFAVLEVPKGTRPAKSLMERVVSVRKRAAISSLARSFLLRACRSCSHQPSRCSSGAILRLGETPTGQAAGATKGR